MFGLSRKSSTISLEALRAGLAGWIGWGSSSGVEVTDRTALDITAVFCGARVIAEGCAQVPVRVVRDVRRGVNRHVEPMPDHWAHRLLAERPNAWQTPYEFVEGMVFNAVLGRGSIAIKVMVDGTVRELLPIPAGSWSIEQLLDWDVRFRVDYADKTHGYFSRDQVLHLRGPSLNGFDALPAVRQARDAIGLSRALKSQQAKLAGNGGKPSGILSFKNPLKPETQERLKSTWQEKYGINGDGGIAILDGDASFASMTMNNVDSQYIETRRFQIEEIARALRLQPIMLMQSDKATTFASVEQMFRMHVIHSLTPWFTRFEQAATRDLLADEPGLRVDLDERGLTRGDFKDQAEYYTKALGAGGQPGWMTPNEIRLEVGLNPVTDPFADIVPHGAMNPAPDAAPAADVSAPQEVPDVV